MLQGPFWKPCDLARLVDHDAFGLGHLYSPPNAAVMAAV